jgi:hypothetical protein
LQNVELRSNREEKKGISKETKNGKKYIYNNSNNNKMSSIDGVELVGYEILV